MVSITRKAEFCASHYCANPRLSPSENEALYGKASSPSGHGHNYVLEVTVTGEADPVHGMVMNLKDLKQIMHEEVVEVYDHRFLNHEVAPFDRVVPTAENIARDIWRRLEPRINQPRINEQGINEPRINGNGRRLYSIRLYETPDLYVDYTGEARDTGFAA
jgi:6-pyruvoyltetrahydropterin/6-carboxytetrahydropterin synthase